MDRRDEDEEPTYLIIRNLQQAVAESDDVDLEEYLRFWRQVCRMMSEWGAVFGFVVSDVNDKISKLMQKKNSDSEGYRSFLSMATKEKENGTIRNPKPNRSGTGHIMVLNRALEFVIDMLDGVYSASDPATKVSSIARASYQEHLSHFHSWPVRAAVSAALFTLPRKREFLMRIRGQAPESDDAQFHAVFLRNGREIVRRVNVLVQAFELTDWNPSA